MAFDQNGEIAAGTSTGGTVGKYAGRVGDSPIAGAGVYAAKDLGGISATGHGETILRTVLSYRALRALAEADQNRPDPAETLFEEIEAATVLAGGRAGLIAILKDGRVAWARNTQHMGVAWAEAGGKVHTAF